MRGAALRLLLSPSTRRAWHQQSGGGRLEAMFLSNSPILPSLFSTSSTSSSSSNPPPPPNLHLLDRVFVTRMPFFARHGVHPAEAELGQRFEVSAEVFIEGLGKSVLAEDGESLEGSNSYSVPPDSVSRTFDYSRIHAVAQRIVQDGPRAQLVETLATRIADALLKEEEGGGNETTSSGSFFEVVGARVKVTKPGAPIQGVFGEAGCEVVRWKKEQRWG